MFNKIVTRLSAVLASAAVALYRRAPFLDTSASQLVLHGEATRLHNATSCKTNRNEPPSASFSYFHRVKYALHSGRTLLRPRLPLSLCPDVATLLLDARAAEPRAVAVVLLAMRADNSIRDTLTQKG